VEIGGNVGFGLWKLLGNDGSVGCGNLGEMVGVGFRNYGKMVGVCCGKIGEMVGMDCGKCGEIVGVGCVNFGEMVGVGYGNFGEMVDLCCWNFGEIVCVDVAMNGCFILFVTVYVYGTWLLTLRDKRRLRVFEKRVFGRIFLCKRDEVYWECRKVHNEELNDIYCSPNVITLIDSTRMRRAKHVARVGRGEAYSGFSWGNQNERDYLGYIGLDRMIILRCTFGKCDAVLWTGTTWLRIGTEGRGM
jgi:hypothetical protein